MRSLFFFLLILLSFNSFEQYREVYSGISMNNYNWTGLNNELNQNKYTAGFQIGVLTSPKLKFIRGIGKGLISPYASFEYSNARSELASHDILQIHAVRAALPTRLRMFVFSEKRNSFYVLIEPGINLSFLQTTSSRLVDVPKINPVDFYLNAGLGSTINFNQKEVLKAGYKCSGISISASKYLPFGVFRKSNFTTTGILDQFRLNIGLRFTYREPIKKNKGFFKRLFGKE